MSVIGGFAGSVRARISTNSSVGGVTRRLTTGRSSLDSSAAAPDRRVGEKIRSGQRVLKRLRCKVAACLLTVALIFGLVPQWLPYPWEDGVSVDVMCSMPVSWICWNIGLAFTWYARALSLNLIPLADDICVTRLVLFTDFCIVVSADYRTWARVAPRQHRPWVNVLRVWMVLASDIPFLIGVLLALRCRRVCDMQRLMWKTLAVWAMLGILAGATLTVATIVYCDYFELGGLYGLAWVPAQIVTIIAARSPEWRHRVHAKLNRMFDVRSKSRAAAGIAGLVGSSPASVVLAEAATRFRCISLDQLEHGDVADNTPAVGLFSKSVSTRLNKCDAFVSHSWSDCAPEKWTALQTWRDEFKSSKGREPCVWFDKCCLDQTNIEADLRCLPVFLSGCKRMVVLCGVTYLTRLWCVIELFTFVQIGRKMDELRFEPVLREGHEQSDLLTVANSFLNFDAEQCVCFLKEDKERMLGVIRLAFGDVKTFSAEVQGMFRQMGWLVKLRSSRHLEVLSPAPSLGLGAIDDASPMSGDSEGTSQRTDSDDASSPGDCGLECASCALNADATSSSDDAMGSAHRED